MKVLITLILLFGVSDVGALQGFEEEDTSTRSKYVSDGPEELAPQNILFDRSGNMIRVAKDEKKEKAKKKKKKKEKRKKMTKKPGKRRPKAWAEAKSKADAKAQARTERKEKKAPVESPEETMPEAEEPPDAPPEGEGEGFDYGGVNVDDDSKVAIPGGSGQGQGETFRPSPPQGQ